MLKFRGIFADIDNDCDDSWKKNIEVFQQNRKKNLAFGHIWCIVLVSFYFSDLLFFFKTAKEVGILVKYAEFGRGAGSDLTSPYRFTPKDAAARAR